MYRISNISLLEDSFTVRDLKKILVTFYFCIFKVSSCIFYVFSDEF